MSARALLASWVAFWDRREAPSSLALVRILVAGALLVDLLAAVGGDAITLLWAPPPLGAGVGAPPWLGGSTGAHVLWAAAVLCCALVLFGVAYRVTSWLLVFAMVALGRCQPAGDGIDVLLRIVLPLLAMSGAHGAWSFDAWWRSRRDRPVLNTVPAWPRYLLMLQLLWLYFSAAHHRGRSWGPKDGFSAIGNVLSDPHFARFTPGSLHVLSPLMRGATLLTMLFELSAPLFFLLYWLDRGPERGGKLGRFVRRWKLRWVWFSIGVSLHLGIALTMRIGMFPYAILALYPALVHPDELLSLVARCGSWRVPAAARS